MTSRKSSVSTKTEGISDPFAPLTWDDLTVWAGPKIVSRGQGYRRRVQELASTTDGALVAWVLGSDQYATRVAIKRKKLTSDCTCPYGATCKHAVAVVLEYLECLKQQRPVPRAGKDDPRLQELAAMDEPDDWDYEEEEDDDELADIGPHGRPPQRPLAPAPQAQRRNRLRSGARMRGDTFFDSLK